MSRLDRDQWMVVVLVAALVTGSVLAVSAGLFHPPAETSNVESGETYDVDPGGMNDVPQDRVTSTGQTTAETEAHGAQNAGIPKPNVSTSRGSQTMNVQIAEQRGKPVMTLSDSQLHDGRWISIPVEWYQDTMGEVPGVAYITHESGDQYAAPISVADGRARFYVKSFSTNTVTWSGQFTLEAYPTEQGAQYSYDHSGSASNYTINVTGATNQEWDNESYSHGPSSTQSIAPAGNLDPAGPSSNSKPTLEVTGTRITKDTGITSDTDLDGNEFVVSNLPPDKYIGEFEFTISDHHADGSHSTDVYLAPGDTADGTIGDGTKIGTCTTNYDQSQSTCTLDPGTAGDMSGYGQFTLEFTDSADIIEAEDDVETPMKLHSPPPTAVSVSTDATASASFGDFTAGETKTKELAVSQSATELQWSGSNGTISYTLYMQERMQTDSPAIQVNSNWTNYSGTISDGSTVSLTTDSAWVVEGSNTVNVSTNVSTSSDDPVMQYDLYYTHDGEDKTEVSYQAEHWSEAYNVSKTFAQDQSNAQLTIPFQGNVISVRNIEKQKNGGGWTTVDSGNYSLSGTTLTVDLGAVASGDEVRVRTTGSKVSVTNGSISVSSPSAPGDPLDSKVDVSSRSGTLEIGVGGTPDGDRIYYTYEEEWAASEHTRITAGGNQTLVFPNDPSAGQSFWVSTLPVSVSPASGDVQIAVTTVDRSKPEFSVSNGDTRGDDVSYTFEDASGGTDYILYSQTNDVVRDSGTAQSPLTLSDDDSVEVLAFLVDDGSTDSSTDGGSSGGTLLPGASSQDTDLLPLLGVALAIGALIVVSRNDEAVTNAGTGAADSIERSLGRIPLVGPALGQGLSGLTQSGAQLAQAALSNKTITYALIAALGVYATTSGIIALPAGSLVLLVVAVVSIGALLALQEYDEFTFRKWAAVVFAISVVALQVLRPAPILESVVDSQIFPIIAISGIYLLYELVQAFRDRQQPRPIIVQTDGGNSGGDEN